RQRVPPREAVDDERVAGLGAQVERLVDDALARQLVRLAAPAEQADAAEQELERARPVLLGSEQEADLVALHAATSTRGARLRRAGAGGAAPRGGRGARRPSRGRRGAPRAGR